MGFGELALGTPFDGGRGGLRPMSSPSHSRQESSQAIDRLQRIVNVTKELNSTLDLSELARIIMRIVPAEVGFERGTVWVMARTAII